MNAPNALTPTARSNRLGRTAMMVLVLGLITSAGMVGIATYVGFAVPSARTVDMLPVLGMAIAIALVSCCWALVLAVRAVRSGESSVWPMWVLNTTMILPAVFGLSAWFDTASYYSVKPMWMHDYHVCVLLPFFSFVCITGTLMFRPLVKALDRRRNAAGKTPWTRSDRRRRMGWFVFEYLLLLTIFVLPIFLYLNAVLNPNRFQRQRGIVGWCPEYVSGTVESLLSFEPNGAWRDARLDILLQDGYAPLQRLKKRSNDPDPKIQECALFGAALKDPKWAAEQALLLLLSKSARSSPPYDMAAVLLARYGTVAQKKAYLDAAMQGQSVNLELFLSSLKPDEQLIPDLKNILKSRVGGRQYALMKLAALLPEDEVVTILTDAHKSGDSELTIRIPTRFLYYLLDQPDVALRGQVIRISSTYYSHSPSPVPADLMKKLLGLVSGNDLSLRRGAAIILRRILLSKIDASITKTILDVRFVLRVSTESALSPESVEEKAAIEQIRRIAEEWLKEHP